MTTILFVDCDGTIRKPKSRAKFIQSPDDQQIIKGAENAIASWKEQGYAIVGITNQGGVAAKHKTLESAIAEQRYTLNLFPLLSEIYFCPDYEGLICWRVTRDGEFNITNNEPVEEKYKFRKPGCGMILMASNLFSGNLEECWMVGDSPEDEGAAVNAGIRFMWAGDWRLAHKV
ncbi:HAD-IIIA family hydrolase [Limnofasciculus baicalensis]|uniref:D,D-heptose 1,7-bisphosphate phosphatase n=1 Tax=Limnofasciculus baicalensis BBK-W-15 TaxID=2699891 RepID=A0AAE3GU21_9CYAN|nr:HAD-IIIA family hydrolase [Limnofasciculus baicalensis]MCP2730489.1 HAD-IIIA family hydrolase [Limnofasciculus baicalensis BBK-W-15]